MCIFNFNIVIKYLNICSYHVCHFFLFNLGMKEMDTIKEEDRLRRLQILEKKIRDPRSVSNVDSLLVRIFFFTRSTYIILYLFFIKIVSTN